MADHNRLSIAGLDMMLARKQRPNARLSLFALTNVKIQQISIQQECYSSYIEYDLT